MKKQHGNKGRRLSEAHKKKISVKNSGENHPMFGKKHSEKTKRQIGKKSKGRCAGEKSNFWKGGIDTPEHRSWIKNKRNRVLKRLKGNGLTHTFGEWELLKKQYGFSCPCCGKSEPEISLTEDHIIPLSKGGSDLIENIQPLCMQCNSKKHTKTVKY